MSQDILVRLTVPILPRAMIYACWLPINESDFLIFDEGDLKVKLWLDISCTYSAFQHSVDELPTWANVTAQRIFIDVTLKNISDEVVTFILNKENQPSLNSVMNHEYEQMGYRVIDKAIKYFNRFVTYVRNEKGQYWLQQYIFDPENISSHNLEFAAKAQANVPDPKWFIWKPTNTGTLNLSIQMGVHDTYIKQEEWSKIREFMSSSARPALVSELLANADNLAENDHRRSAIIEAVTALEVAVNEFSKSPRFDRIIRTDRLNRININAFESQVKHLGFSATLRYLLPLLFEESDLSTDLLSACQDAVAIRGNIVHEGQRNINKGRMLDLLRAIRQTCLVLQHNTAG